jgi:hypothetical protein
LRDDVRRESALLLRASTQVVPRLGKSIRRIECVALVARSSIAPGIQAVDEYATLPATIVDANDLHEELKIYEAWIAIQIAIQIKNARHCACR